MAASGKKSKAEIIEGTLLKLKEYAKKNELSHYDMYDKMLKQLSIQQIVGAFEVGLVPAYCLDKETGVRDYMKQELKLVNLTLDKPIDMDAIPAEHLNHIVNETIFIIKVIMHGKGEAHYLALHAEKLRKKGIKA